MRESTLLQPKRTVDHPLMVIERILRDREGIWRQISSEYRLNTLILQMLVSSTIALGCYGIVLGSSSGLAQAISSAIKLPILFLLTLAICLPTLYLFNLVFGARLSIQQAVALVLTAVTVTSVLTLAFAPISVFFSITAPNYTFFKLMNVAILALTGTIGLSFLHTGMRRMNMLNPLVTATAPEPSEGGEDARPHRVEPRIHMGLLNLWVVLFGFVGTQLAWTLRPFFGYPDKPFEIFRNLESNFYINILHSLAKALS